MIEHTSEISRTLYSRGNAVKSENYALQKSTYSGQKHRNLVKMMMCVQPDGMIANVFGPYKAGENYASILKRTLNESPEALFNYMKRMLW